MRRGWSIGFAFDGTYTEIDAPRKVASRLDDDRMVTVLFIHERDAVRVRGTFDAETQNDPVFQRQGWQAILDSFGRHVGRLKTA